MSFKYSEAQWRKTDARMKEPRKGGADIVLEDGRRIVSGGKTTTDFTFSRLNSTEILGDEGVCYANEITNSFQVGSKGLVFQTKEICTAWLKSAAKNFSLLVDTS